MSKFDRRSFLRALDAFFAVTRANCSATIHVLVEPSDRTHSTQYSHSPDGCTLTANVAQNLYVPLGHPAASLP